jgi:hypothetical protein
MFNMNPSMFNLLYHFLVALVLVCILGSIVWLGLAVIALVLSRYS